jgi:hypothetical protein
MKCLLATALFHALALAAPAKDVEKRASACTITTYTQSGSMSSCSSITIAAQTVPGGEPLSLTDIPDDITVSLSKCTLSRQYSSLFSDAQFEHIQAASK